MTGREKEAQILSMLRELTDLYSRGWKTFINGIQRPIDIIPIQRNSNIQGTVADWWRALNILRKLLTLSQDERLAVQMMTRLPYPKR